MKEFRCIQAEQLEHAAPDPATSKAEETIAAIEKVLQKAFATIVAAFQAAQLDPQQAAKIQEIAAKLKAIRDRQ